MATELLCDRNGCRRIAKRYTITTPDGTESVCLCDTDARQIRLWFDLGRRVREAAAEARGGRSALTRDRMESLVDRGPSKGRRR